MGLPARRTAGRDHGRVRDLAQGARLGRRRGLGSAFASFGAAHGAGDAEAEGGGTKLFVRPSETADLAATLQSGVIVNIRNCDGAWCLIDGNGFKGYIQQVKLWGAYPNEKIE